MGAATATTTLITMAGLSTQQQAQLQHILHDPLIGIVGTQDEFRQRLIEKEEVPESQVDEAILEYRRFLGLALVGYAELGMFSPIIDKVWHLHILCTKDYLAFCQEAFGRFVHHCPNFSVAQRDPGGFDHFRTIYEALYGHHLPSVWSSDQNSCKKHCDVANCSECKGA